MRLFHWAALSCLAGAITCASGSVVQAQQQQGQDTQAQNERTRIISPILTIDSDRVFWESAYGKRVEAEIAQQQAALTAENTEIRDALAAEEKQLTERRAGMDPEAFRKLADEFDKKVQDTSAAQIAKATALQNLPDQEVAAFLNRAAPVFEQIMRDTGAGIILERRSAFVSASAIEITDAAIAAIDQIIGDGSAPPE